MSSKKSGGPTSNQSSGSADEGGRLELEKRKRNSRAKKHIWEQRFVIHPDDLRATLSELSRVQRSSNDCTTIQIHDSKSEREIRESLTEKLPKLEGKRFMFFTKVETKNRFCPCSCDCEDTAHVEKPTAEWNGKNIKKMAKGNRVVYILCLCKETAVNERNGESTASAVSQTLADCSTPQSSTSISSQFHLRKRCARDDLFPGLATKRTLTDEDVTFLVDTRSLQDQTMGRRAEEKENEDEEKQVDVATDDDDHDHHEEKEEKRQQQQQQLMQLDNEVRMLQEFLAEQNAKEARLKEQRAPKKRDAGIQCDVHHDAVSTKPQTSNAAVQTDMVDVMEELKQQVRNLSQIVAELTAHKTQRPYPGPMLSELFSDLPDLCQDSYENSDISATENPLPGLTDLPASLPVTSSLPANLPSRPPLTTIQQNSPTVSYQSYGPTDEQRRKVEAISLRGSQMSTTALACVDVLFTEEELVNGNTGGTCGYNKLDKHKLGFLRSVLRQKFDSPSFEAEWENTRGKINSKCRGKRRTVVKRLKNQAI